jgi:hemerythrin superfamily protein
MIRHHTRARFALQGLRQDHGEIRELFHEYEAHPSEDREPREKLFRQIRSLVLIHCALEEDIVFPTLRRLGTERASRVLDESRQGHGRLWKLMADLEQLDRRHPLFDARMGLFRKAWEEYAARESVTLFEEVRGMSPEARQALRTELQRRRVHWLKP